MASLPIDRGEDVLAETRKLKRLARGLLYDRSRAEDVVQEAWLATVRATPSQTPFAWLAGVVRRLAANENRAGARTRRRERAAARPEALPSTVDSLARVETLKRVVEAVGELDEPYRGTILQRFFDELPPRAIAKHQGVPVETVRTRIRRGLELLRRRLDGSREAGRGSLLAVLLPIAGKPPWAIALGSSAGSSSLLPWTGALVMSRTLQLSAATLLAALLSIIGYRVLSNEGESPATSRADVGLEPALVRAAPEAPATGLVADEDSSGRRVADLVPTASGDWIVRGHLTLGIDDPFPGGRVRVELFEGRIDAGSPTSDAARFEVVVADESGEFECPFPTPETAVTVVARPDVPKHFAIKDWETAALGQPPPQMLNPRAYPRDSTLVGRVVDPDGRPVRGAHVTTYRSEGETGADGRFAVAASSVTSKIMGKVLAPGFAEQRISAVPLAPGRIDAGDIVLAPGLRVTGRVVDELGRAVEDATVSTSWMGYGKPLHYETATTDATGSFALDQVDVSRHNLSVSAMKEGYVLSSVVLKGPDDEAPKTEVLIVLKVGGVVRGHVAWADGAPASDVWICVGFNPSGIPRVDAYSDENGYFELPHVPSGAQTLWAVRRGKATVQVPIEVPEEGGVLDGLALTLADGHFLAGVVLDENETPMPWVLVYAEARRRGGEEAYVSMSPSTDRDGRFRIEGLPDGAVTLGFLEGGYSRYEETFQVLDRRDLVIRLRHAGRLAGRVLDGRTGAPLESFVIRFVSPALEAGEERLYGYWARWGGEGITFAGTGGAWNADSEDLELGKWIAIEASAPGYGPAVATRVQTVPLPDPDDLVLRLFAGAVVRGFVSEATSGRPVAGATVKRFTDAEPLGSQRWEQEHPYWTTTDANGHFELGEVPAGEMSLGIDHPEWGLSLDGPFDVPEGGVTVERRIAVDEGRVLTGRLLDVGGAPLVAESLELRALDTDGEKYRVSRATTEEHGAFLFKNLLAGLYHLQWVEARGGTTCSRITKLVEIEESGEPQSALLQLEGKATLRGTLIYEGTLPELVAVTITGRDAIDPRTTRDGSSYASLAYGVFAEHGEFALAGLQPGRYSVHTFIDSGQPGVFISGSSTVDVPSEGTIDVAVEVKRSEH